MIKRYVRWQLKKWLPMALVSFILMFLIFVVACSFATPYQIQYSSNSNPISPYPPFLYILIPAIICSVIIPLFVCDYHYKRNSADLFLEAPFKKGELLRIRALLGLGILLAGFTISFMFGTMVMSIRQASFETVTDSGITYIHYMYNYWGFFLVYLWSLLTLSLTYYVNVLIASFASNRTAATEYLIFVQTFLSISTSVFFFFISQISRITYFSPMSSMGLSYVATSIEPLFYYLTVDGKFQFELMLQDYCLWEKGAFIVHSVFFFLIGGASCFLVNYGWKENGEEMGKPSTSLIFPRMFVHVFYLLVGMAISLLFLGTIALYNIALFLIYAIMYYVNICTLQRRFKLDKLDLYSMISVFALSFIECIVMSSVTY